jgi:hypothetical protein
MIKVFWYGAWKIFCVIFAKFGLSSFICEWFLIGPSSIIFQWLFGSRLKVNKFSELAYLTSCHKLNNNFTIRKSKQVSNPNIPSIPIKSIQLSCIRYKNHSIHLIMRKLCPCYVGRINDKPLFFSQLH